MCAPYHSTLNGGKASDWLRPVPCRQEGDKLPKGQYQSDNGYSTRVHLPGHLACNPSSQREASHVSSQGKEAVFVTHDIYVVPPQSWGDRSDTKHSKCLLLGGRWLNQLTLIPKPKGSGGARAATAQVGPANKGNDTKRCLPVEASLRPGEAVPW